MLIKKITIFERCRLLRLWKWIFLEKRIRRKHLIKLCNKFVFFLLITRSCFAYVALRNITHTFQKKKKNSFNETQKEKKHIKITCLTSFSFRRSNNFCSLTNWHLRIKSQIKISNFVLFSIPPYFQDRSTQNDIPEQRWSLSSTSSYNPPTIPFPFAFHSTILILLVRHSYHNRIARLPSVFRLVGGKRNRHVAYRSERIPHWESVYPNFACRFRKEIFQIYVKTWIVVHDVSTIVPYFFRTTPPLPPPLLLRSSSSFHNNFSCQVFFLPMNSNLVSE